MRGPGGYPFAQFDPFAIGKGPIKKQCRLARPARTGAETALPQSVFREVVAQVEALPRKLPKDIEVYWRTWWAVRLCYFSLFRRSEVVGGLMGDFQKAQDGWVAHVVGKGWKPATLPSPRDANATETALARRHYVPRGRIKRNGSGSTCFATYLA